jgi:hypothetical protein
MSSPFNSNGDVANAFSLEKNLAGAYPALREALIYKERNKGPHPSWAPVD